MPTHMHLVQVARELKRKLGKQAFLTVPRSDVTQLLRQISGEDATRIKNAMGDDLEHALLEQGVRCFPRLVGTTSGDHIRLFHAGTVMGGFVDMLLYPSEETDRELAAAITKFKGKWDWGPVTRGLEPATEEASPVS
jgi:hypothetical protein